jgi:hypothetical protein
MDVTDGACSNEGHGYWLGWEGGLSGGPRALPCPYFNVSTPCPETAGVLIFVKQANDYVRFEVFTAGTMKNAVFWDIKTQFVLHRRNITSALQSPAS